MSDLEAWYPDRRTPFAILRLRDVRRRAVALEWARRRAQARRPGFTRALEAVRTTLTSNGRGSLEAHLRYDDTFTSFASKGSDALTSSALLGAELALTARDLIGVDGYAPEHHLDLLWPVNGVVRGINEAAFALAYERQIRLIADRPHGDWGLRLDVLVDRTGLHEIDESELTETPMNLRLEHEPGGRLLIRFELDDDIEDAGRLEAVIEIAQRHRGTRYDSTWCIALDERPEQAAIEAVRLIAAMSGLGEHDLIELVPYDDDDWHLARSERRHEADWHGIRSFPTLTIDDALNHPEVQDRAARPLTYGTIDGSRAWTGSVESARDYDSVPPLLVDPHCLRPMTYRFALRDRSYAEGDRIDIVETIAESEEEAYANCLASRHRPEALWSVTSALIEAQFVDSADGPSAVLRAGSEAAAVAQATAWGLGPVVSCASGWVGPGDQLDTALQDALGHPSLDRRWAPLVRALGWALEHLPPRGPRTLQTYAGAAGFESDGSPWVRFTRRPDGTMLVEVTGAGSAETVSLRPHSRDILMPRWRFPDSGDAGPGNPRNEASPYVHKVAPGHTSGFTIAADSLAMLCDSWNLDPRDQFTLVGDDRALMNVRGIERVGDAAIWRLSGTRVTIDV